MVSVGLSRRPASIWPLDVMQFWVSMSPIRCFRPATRRRECQHGEKETINSQWREPPYNSNTLRETLVAFARNICCYQACLSTSAYLALRPPLCFFRPLPRWMMHPHGPARWSRSTTRRHTFGFREIFSLPNKLSAQDIFLFSFISLAGRSADFFDG